MKRFLMMLAALTVVSFTVNAQKGFTVGARLGPGFAFNELEDELEDYVRDRANSYFGTSSFPFGIDEKSNMAFVVAVYGNYAFFPNIPKFSIQAELHFMVNNGIELDVSAPGYGNVGEVKGTFPVLDIPVLARYEFFETPVSLSVLGGPYLSFPIGKLEMKEKDAFGGGSGSAKFDIDGIRFGITLGVAAGYKLGPGNIVADLRFLTDLAPVVVDEGVKTDILTRRGINLTVGYEMKF